MPKRLSQAQVSAYQRDGYAFPIGAFTAAEAAELRRRLEAIAAAEGGKLSKSTNQKPHLLFPWLADLVRHPALLDPVEDVLGPDILCWASGFFWKPARDQCYVSWHQDSTYWGLSAPDVATAWLAFTPSTRASGCMRVLPGSQAQEQIPHKDTFASYNLLSRGQEVQVAVDEALAVDVELGPGELSLHHVRIVHGSEPNRSDDARIGFAVRYVAAHVRQLSTVKDSASLVRGRDPYGHFEHEPRPQAELHPDAVAYHRSMPERYVAILYDGALKRPDYGQEAARRA